MVNLIADLADIIALLYGERGGVVLVILFLGTLFFMGSLMIIVLTLVRFFSFVFSLLRKVFLRYRNRTLSIWKSDTLPAVLPVHGKRRWRSLRGAGRQRVPQTDAY
ncbi:hypothetical protein D1D72_00325 [Salmonella enterica]|nr:hypothetical protein [Salmonella enterica]